MTGIYQIRRRHSRKKQALSHLPQSFYGVWSPRLQCPNPPPVEPREQSLELRVLARWAGFAAFLEDGRICLSNNAAERALRGIALGRKAWLFAGSDRGARRAAFMYTLKSHTNWA